MVTEKTAYIGTSNWSGDFFINTAGIGLILTDSNYDLHHHSHHESNQFSDDDNVNNKNNSSASSFTIRDDLENLFKRDWYSSYSFKLT